MGSGGRSALIYNTVVALAGAAVMFALVLSGISEPSAVDDRAAARRWPAKTLPSTDRLAFVPPGIWSPSKTLPIDIAEPTPGNAAKSDNAGAWSTKIQPEAAIQPSDIPYSGWRFTLQPAFRSPSQLAKPAPPQRTATLKARLAEISPAATMRLAAKFEAAKATWPPAEIALVAIKDERTLELHARPSGGAWTLVHRYRVLAASGGVGPKLVQGDRQVPEGVYAIAFLNPNSAYHLSLRVNYPNAFDRQMAAKDGRSNLGGDIMIHGRNLSAGCLAMGDEAVEELFVLAAQTRLPNVRLIIAPTDLRVSGAPPIEPGRPDWLPRLYADLAIAMSEFKAPRPTGLLSYFAR